MTTGYLRSHRGTMPKPLTMRPPNRGIKRIIFAALFLTIICAIINPSIDQQVDAKKLKLKLKDKKVLKSVVKGLIFKNLSTRKNFLPLPVPIPVRIELSEPPVYLKGKPRYVTIYKPAPIPKPSPPVYNVNVYPGSYESPSVSNNIYGGLYSSPAQGIMTGTPSSYLGLSAGSSNSMKQSTSASDYSSTPVSLVNFNDFDDDFGNYYLRKQQSSALAGPSANSITLNEVIRRGDKNEADLSDEASSNDGEWVLLNADEESIDNQDAPEMSYHSRIKRQAYESSYENEPPCYGFPLEINIKSRIKMDQIFPIHGKSQIKKCIKIGKPLLPPVEDYPPY